MAANLRCRIGIHKWKVELNPEGERYQRCERCGNDMTVAPGQPGIGHMGGGG